jgi:hypothetical protein
MRPDAPERTSPTLACCRCGRTIDLCAFCERAECAVSTCYACLRVAVGQEMAQPHDHGG